MFERETIANVQLPFLDLSKTGDADRERLTVEAMARGEAIREHEQIVDALRRRDANELRILMYNHVQKKCDAVCRNSRPVRSSLWGLGPRPRS